MRWSQIWQFCDQVSFSHVKTSHHLTQRTLVSVSLSWA